MRFDVGACCRAASVALLLGSPAGAAFLDPSFGAGGKVVTYTSAYDGAVGVVVEPSTGRLFVAGGEGALVRYLPDGTVDASFGSGGSISVASPGFETVNTLLRQPADGDLLAVGSVFNPYFSGGTVIRRFDPDGNLDASFGSGGTASSSDPEDPLAALVQPDGAILVAGRSGINSPGFPAAIALFLPDGTLDPGFGSGGVVFTGTGSGPGNFVPNALAIVDGGKIVAVGGGSVASSFELARYASDGTLDTTFGTGGHVSTPFPEVFVAEAHAVVPQADGKIVVVGTGYESYIDYPPIVAAARYLADGTLDSTYGTGGRMFVQIAPAGPSAAALADGDGVIVASNGILLRLTVDGAPDPAFAPCTFSFQPFLGAVGIGSSSGGNSQMSVDRQPDGKIVVAGGKSGGGSLRMLRYVTGSPACQPAAPAASKMSSRPAPTAYPTNLPTDGPRLKWTWKGNGTVLATDFGDPVSIDGDAYAACLVDAGTSTLSRTVFVEPNDSECAPPYPGGFPCWQPDPRGLKLAQRDRRHALTIRLLSGAAGKAKLVVTARAQTTRELEPPAYVTPVLVRLERSGTPYCWDAQFSTPTRDDATRFTATSD